VHLESIKIRKTNKALYLLFQLAKGPDSGPSYRKAEAEAEAKEVG